MVEAPSPERPFWGSRPFGVAGAQTAKLRRWIGRFPGALGEAVADALAERRAFVFAPFVFIFGLVAYRMLPGEPHALLLAGGLLVSWLAVLHQRARFAGLRLAALGAVFWGGLCALPVHGALFGTSMLTAPAYGHYSARLDRIIYDDGESQRWILSEIVAADSRADIEVRRARVNVSEPLNIRPGDIVTARIRFYPVPAPVFFGGYDAQFAGYYAGIGAYGAVLGDDIAVAPAETGGVFRLIEEVRAHIAQRILAVLGDRPGGIAVALINGDQSRVSEEDRNTMALVGLAHVLSISGLHLTLVAGTMYATLRAGLSLSARLTERWPVKKIAAAGGILTAIGYMLISGMEVPAVRSTLMLILVFGAVLAGRQALTMRNVALAGLLLAALDPASVFRASFQLSFAAVVALIAAYELARIVRDKREGPRNRAAAIVVDMAMASLVAGLATVVFTAYHFQQTAPFGVLGNVLAGPIISFVMMPAALFAMLLLPFGLEAPLLHVMGWSIDIMLWIAHVVGVMSGGFDPSPLLAPTSLVVALMGLAWLAVFRTRIRLLGPALVVPLIALFCTESWPDVLIADTTQALAVRHEGGLALMAGRSGTFATTVWSERFMEPIDSRHEDTGCDNLGCVLVSSAGFTVALVRNPAAFAEDCAIADLVVTRLPAPPACRAQTETVDIVDLERRGAHMLRWDAGMGRFVTQTAITDTARPWRLQYD